MSEPIVNVSASLQQVVSVIYSQMDDLARQKADLSREMRNLRRQLQVLRSAECVAAGAKAGRQARRRKGALHKVRSRRARGFSDELSRACKIAMLEVEGDPTAAEIHSRITRRGSYVFAAGEDPIAAITNTLIAMFESGESADYPRVPDISSEFKSPEHPAATPHNSPPGFVKRRGNW